METEQLDVGDERICPRTNYENDGAAEKIRQTRELLDELAVRVAEELLKKTDLADWAKRAQKPAYTAPEVGADVAGSAAGALADAKAYADGTYMQATGYTDSEIAKLINGSQTTLETIKQLSDAMQENEDIVDALENAMGSKASEVEFQAHAANETVHVTESEKEGWNAAAEHGRSGHAPANAERNTIAGIKRNGSGLVPDRNRNVDITVPTKISQLENDVIKKIAFSGQYSDLTGAPTSLKNPQALSFSGAAAGNYDGSVAKSVHIPSGTNGLMATAAGTWLDAVQGKALKGLWDQHEAKINKINSDLSKLGNMDLWGKIYSVSAFPGREVTGNAVVCSMSVPAGIYIVTGTVSSQTDGTYFSIGFHEEIYVLPRASVPGYSNGNRVATANVTDMVQFTSQGTINLWITPYKSMNIYQYLLKAIKIA